MNRGQIKTNVRSNLDEASAAFYTEVDLNDSLQDGYDDIVILSQCIVKSVTLNWHNDLSYLNFRDDYGITDYLGTIAIYNNPTRFWLRDDLSLRSFDKIRLDWEKWTGTPQFWAPSDPLHIAIAPKYNNVTTVDGAFDAGGFSNGFFVNTSMSASLTFRLLYWAIAPTLTTDGSTFLISTDAQDMLEFYVTADMLEQQNEFTKASEYWTKYYNSLIAYSSRVKRINKSDLLLRV